MDTKLFSSHKKSKYNCIPSVLNTLTIFSFLSFFGVPFFPESVSVRFLCLSVYWNPFNKGTSDLRVAKPISNSQPLSLSLHSIGFQQCWIVKLFSAWFLWHCPQRFFPPHQPLVLALDIPLLFNLWKFSCTYPRSRGVTWLQCWLYMEDFQIFNSSPAFYTNVQIYTSIGLSEISVHMFGIYLKFAVSNDKFGLLLLLQKQTKNFLLSSCYSCQ